MIDEKKLIDAIETYAKDKTDIGYWYDRLWGMRMAIEIINQQPKVGEWIPCSERLPDEGKEVLISYDYDSFDIEMTPKRYLGVMIGYYEDSEWWSGDEWTDGVTAWYPLPEPWKGDLK